MYKKLEIDFQITQELSDWIERYLEHINTTRGTSEDYYRMEIDLELKDELARHVLSHDQYTELRDYYVLCGVYAELGKPYLREKI